MELSKITKKRYIATTTKVLTRKDLQDALKRRYQKIIIEGKLGKRLYNEMNGFSSSNQIKDKVVDIIFDNGSLKGLNKELKDYKMVSSTATETVIELRTEKKGFIKKL